MIDNETHLHPHYYLQGVFISFIISFLGAYYATSLCEQLRANYLIGRGFTSNIAKWYSLMGLSLGGVGIWCMHFVGVASVSIEIHSTDAITGELITTPVPMHFNIAISILSLIVVLVMTTVGVAISANDRLFMKTKGEILEMFIKDTSKLSISELRKMKNYRLFALIATKDLKYLLVGGACAGSGVSVMHYVGMKSMTFHGRIVYDPGLVFLSVIVAIVAATIAFSILFRLLSLFPNREFLRIISSFLMACAVCGMHYTGMAASSFVYEPGDHQDDAHVPSEEMDEYDARYPVISAAVICMAIIVLVVLSDLRKMVHKYNLQARRNMLLMVAAEQNNSSGNSSFRRGQQSPSPTHAHLFGRGRSTGNLYPHVSSNSGSNSSHGSIKHLSIPIQRAVTPEYNHYERPNNSPTSAARRFRNFFRPQASFVTSFPSLKLFPSYRGVSPSENTEVPSDHKLSSDSMDLATASDESMVSGTINTSMITHSNTSAVELMELMSGGISPRWNVPPRQTYKPSKRFLHSNVFIDDDMDIENCGEADNV